MQRAFASVSRSAVARIHCNSGHAAAFRAAAPCAGAVRPFSTVQSEAAKPTVMVPVTDIPISPRFRTLLEDNYQIKSLFPIQAQVYAPILNGKDVVARSKTGSGKTLAFLLPILEKLTQDNRRTEPFQVRILVLEPTRELAIQVCEQLDKLKARHIKHASVYGGVSYESQKRALAAGCEVVAATPGRLRDLIEQNSFNMSTVEVVVIDEADRMLDMGFKEEVEAILKGCTNKPQMLLFSATMPRWVMELMRNFTQNPTRIDVITENEGSTPDTIDIRSLMMTNDAPRRAFAIMQLITVLKAKRVILFCDTKVSCNFYAQHPALRHFCAPLNGDLTQARRQQVISGFKNGSIRILAATDVAARGVDIPDVDLVIHAFVPENHESFVHRVGRTGRAGKKGTAVVLHDEAERGHIGSLSKSIGSAIRPIAIQSSADAGTEALFEDAMERIGRVRSGSLNIATAVARRLLATDKDAFVKLLSAMLPPDALPTSLLTGRTGETSVKIVGCLSKDAAARVIGARTGIPVSSWNVEKCSNGEFIADVSDSVLAEVINPKKNLDVSVKCTIATTDDISRVVYDAGQALMGSTGNGNRRPSISSSSRGRTNSYSQGRMSQSKPRSSSPYRGASAPGGRYDNVSSSRDGGQYKGRGGGSDFSHRDRSRSDYDSSSMSRNAW